MPCSSTKRPAFPIDGLQSILKAVMRPSSLCFSTWAITDSARSSPFADPVAFEQSSEGVHIFQPSSMRFTGKEWYVPLAQDVHPSVVTPRCCPSSRLAIWERRTPLTSFMSVTILRLEGMGASFLWCSSRSLIDGLSTTSRGASESPSELTRCPKPIATYCLMISVVNR